MGPVARVLRFTGVKRNKSVNPECLSSLGSTARVDTFISSSAGASHLKGTRAADMLESRTDIDILFSDIVMPHGMSGIELARHVRARYPDIRIVLTSAYPLAALRAIMAR